MTKAPINALKPIKMQSVADRIVEQVSVHIRSGTFAPGDRLPSELELAAALNVSRSTVREAKQTLIELGMLTTNGKSGAFISGFDPRERLDEVFKALRDPTHQELHEVREFIEIPAIRLASLRATAEQIDEMYAVMSSIEQRSQHALNNPWGRHSEIHQMIVRASGNPVLASLHDLIIQVLMRMQLPFLPLIADWESEVASHRRLIDAVAQRDADTAASIMAAHLRHSDQYRHDLLKVAGDQR